MDRLKETLIKTEGEERNVSKDKVEVVGLSIASCLNRAAEHWRISLIELDYEILEKGRQSLFKNQPYRIQVTLLPAEQRYADLNEFSAKIGVGDRLLDAELDQHLTPQSVNGRAIVRNYFDGVFLFVFAPQGGGEVVKKEDVLRQLRQAGADNYDMNVVEETMREASGKPVRIADFVHVSENNSSCRVETTNDHMKAYVYIAAPKMGGRHLRVGDIVNAMKSHGIVLGFKEKEIKEALLQNNYKDPILVAEGVKPQHGADAILDYKVNIEREKLELHEDAAGRVDFKNLNIIENVVAGQILVEKRPPTKGKTGYTLFNDMVKARNGQDVPLKEGNGTIISKDQTQLIAQENGQVMFVRGRICVQPVYRVTGDVGPKTGNISFLGSVYVGGVVLDGFEIKAGGNIDVHGGVQKAVIEATGDIIVRSGIHGGHVESNSGIVLARFIQDAEVYSSTDVLVLDGIMRSKIDAGGSIMCNGRLARIVGGRIRAKKEIRTRVIGSQAFAATEITVGIDPIILANLDSLNETKRNIDTAMSKLNKIVATLEARQKSDPRGFKSEQREQLAESKVELDKLENEKKEVQQKIKNFDLQIDEKASDAKIHVEKEIFPGVVVNILKAKQEIIDLQRLVTISYDHGHIRITKLEKRKGTEPSYSKYRR